jgi:phosphatidylserine decarboxylase
MFSGIIAAWREVKSIVLALLGLILLTAGMRRYRLSAVLAVVLGWIFYFFRDPERMLSSPAVEAILSPADGRVTAIEQVDEPHFMGGPAWRVSIFLSLLDVHVQRSPCSGQVKFLRYQSGEFAPAFLAEVRQNESNLIGLQTVRGPVGVKQIAGILARRIVCWREPGDAVLVGQRLGLIRFGSRVDLYLPLEAIVLTQVGQQVYGAKTVIARWSLP